MVLCQYWYTSMVIVLNFVCIFLFCSLFFKNMFYLNYRKCDLYTPIRNKLRCVPLVIVF